MSDTDEPNLPLSLPQDLREQILEKVQGWSQARKKEAVDLALKFTPFEMDLIRQIEELRQERDADRDREDENWLALQEVQKKLKFIRARVADWVYAASEQDYPPIPNELFDLEVDVDGIVKNLENTINRMQGKR